jgi:adenylate cyclase
VQVEFSSVVEAVECAVAVQNEFQTRNAELAENRRMQFRIGINRGDVIDEEGRIYGNGVNIAARLEALADPGGICVSKTAFDQIETKLPLGYEYLGEQSVKNIPKPVGAYRAAWGTESGSYWVEEYRICWKWQEPMAHQDGL